ncbi:MAG: ribbon-helix-helix protein, CopG family [archaeon]
MKKKISISIEAKTITILDSLVLLGNFRNKSHLVESALNQYIGETKKHGKNTHQ